MTTYTPVFWFKLFGLAKWTLGLTEYGVRINDQLWSWEALRSCQVLPGRLWNTVEIEGQTRLQLKGVPKTVAQQLQTLSLVARPIRAAHSLIDQALSSAYYVSDYDRRYLVGELQQQIHWFDSDSPVRHLRHIPALEQQYARVHRYITGDRQELDARNEKFIDAELLNWRDWFAKIEKSPLTDEQARASIVMEDRNLLIAAAGSGKTSTIVAKAAYALAKGYCEPSQLLVLTFNRRIREELVDRIQKRLSIVGLPTDITVKTFHAFGNEQVRKLDKTARPAPWADSQTKAIAHLKSLTASLVKGDPQFAYALADFSAVWLESDEKEEGEILAATDTGSFEEAMRKLVARAAPKGSVPTYVTLTGETVRSLQELRICNWLTLMN